MPEWLKRLTKTDVRNSISLFIVIGTFILMYIMLVKPIPAENKEIVNIAVGFIFGAGFGGVVGYHFSSSKTDKHTINEKDN
jgi:uncharacterized membrane protein YdjX (TVP38/TMEM64 family)